MGATFALQSGFALSKFTRAIEVFFFVFKGLAFWATAGEVASEAATTNDMILAFISSPIFRHPFSSHQLNAEQPKALGGAQNGYLGTIDCGPTMPAVFSMQHLFCFIRGNAIVTRTPIRQMHSVSSNLPRLAGCNCSAGLFYNQEVR